jgi:K+-transporting ATPase c subunit
MGCGPSKKRVEQQQYIQELNARARAKLDEAKQLLNEFSRDLDERHETRKRDARDAKATADALEKSASTLEEKVCAAVAARDADEQIARVARLDKAFAENNATSALRRKRLELQGLVPKNT